jgi:hypothetical protein
MGARGSFPGGKAVGAWSWPLTPSNAEVKECVELYLHSPNTPSWRGAQLKHRMLVNKLVNIRKEHECLERLGKYWTYQLLVYDDDDDDDDDDLLDEDVNTIKRNITTRY